MIFVYVMVIFQLSIGLPVFREMSIKIGFFFPNVLTKIESIDNTHCWQGHGETGFPSLLVLKFLDHFWRAICSICQNLICACPLTHPLQFCNLFYRAAYMGSQRYIYQDVLEAFI